MIRILHPRPVHGRQTFIGIEFRDGVAEVEQLHTEVEASLFQHGFTIEKTEQVEAPKKKRGRQAPPPDPEDPPRGMTVHAVPKITITIDGEEQLVDVDTAYTAAALLEQAGLAADAFELALMVGYPDHIDIETVDTITPQDGQQFISVARAATNG